MNLVFDPPSIPFMTALAACDSHGVIGYRGNLPWHEPEDQEHFRNLTRHHVMIMGRKTYDSLPSILFHDREGIVLSHTRPAGTWCSHVYGVSTPEECVAQISLTPQKLFYVIGGQAIFELFFQRGWINKVILTRLNQTYPGDTWFPLEALREWRCVDQKQHARFVIETWIPPSPSESDAIS